MNRKNVTLLLRTECFPAIAGFTSGIALVVFGIYSLYYCYSWLYSCDCGFNSPLSATDVVQSEDLLWKKFVTCKIKLDQDLSYKITYTPTVTALDDSRISISGFIQPLEAKGTFRHFLLCKNAPSCAYCPPSKPNEIVEVFSAKPMVWRQNICTISGTLHLVSDGKNGIFFQLKDAV